MTENLQIVKNEIQFNYEIKNYIWYLSFGSWTPTYSFHPENSGDWIQ